MGNLRSFLTPKTILAFVLSFTMWAVYYLSDFKVDADDESYLTKSVIYASVLVSLLSTLYFIASLVYSKLSQKVKALIVVVLATAGLGFLYCKFSSNTDFLKQNYALLSLFSFSQLFILCIFGWRSVEDKKVQSSESPVGAADNDSEDDGLEQTKMSLNLGDEH